MNARARATILSTLARRAYRRPVAGDDVETLIGFYRIGRDGGPQWVAYSFEAGIETALQRILVSPDFLFRIEQDPARAAPGAAYPVSDVELASRLSFFLWSSIPDDELLDRAVKGTLRNRGVLEAAGAAHARAIRARRRSSRISPASGCSCATCANAVPDPDLFPEFDENLREAFRRETELFIGSQLRDDRAHPRAADGRLHVPQRAARAPLRHSGRLRQPLPARRHDAAPTAAACSAMAAC